MALLWTKHRWDEVRTQIEAHPPESGRCAQLGRTLPPIAREQDAGASGLIIRANGGRTRYPCFKPRGPIRWWHHHVTVGVQGHCVDALTGAEGTEQDRYLQTHFSNDPNDLCIDRSDPNLEQTWL